MSWYNSVVISFNHSEFEDDEDPDCRECEPLRRINAWLKRRGFEPLSDMNPSGPLGSNAVLFGGCYNYLEVDKFYKYVQRLEWQYPEDVQILYWGDNDVKFAVLRLGPDDA